MTVIRKIVHHRIQRLWCKPIAVFCFHKVSDVYEPLYGGIGDWTETEQFKRNIFHLQKRYTFISIEEAYQHLLHDTFRLRNYAVLTSDDGYQCVLDILPWLREQNVPVTLFISTQYLDGKSYDPWFDAHWADIAADAKDNLLQSMYIQSQHLSSVELNADNVSLCLHGYGHDEVSRMDAKTFHTYMEKCKAAIETHPRFKPFYAYTWGRHSAVTDSVLREKGIVPVYMDGKMNDRWDGALHRVCMDGMKE